MSTKKKIFVLRYQPSGGRVSGNGHVTITFNQQIIELSTVSESDKKIPNVTISPNVEGEWRWEDTKILKFRPKNGFKNDVRYSVKVNKGLVAVSKATLVNDFSFSFRTEPVRIWSFFSKRNNTQTPLMGLYFNVPVEESIMKNVIVKKDSSKTVLETEIVSFSKVREIIKDQTFIFQQQSDYSYFRDYSSESYENQKTVLFFRFKESLPLKSTFNLAFYDQKYTFYTYGDFNLCTASPLIGTKESRCFSITFSNFLKKSIVNDTEVVGEDIKVEISPEMAKTTTIKSKYDEKEKKWIKSQVEQQQVVMYNNYISIYGQFPHGNINYKVKISNLVDVFGQKIDPVVVDIKIIPLQCRLETSYQGINIIDSSRPYNQVLSMLLMNVKKVNLKLFHVKIEDLNTFNRGSIKVGKLFAEHDLDTNASLDVYKVFNFPLDWKLLQNPKERLGSIVIYVEGKEFMANDQSLCKREKRHWFQFTQTSIDIFSFKNRETYACVNSLLDGRFISKDTSFFDENLKQIKAEYTKNNLFKLDMPSYYTYYVIVKSGNDVSFLQGVYENQSSFQSVYKFFVFDDRKIYRPGETANIKGIIRQLIPKGSGYDMIFPIHDQKDVVNFVTYSVRDYNYINLLVNKKVKVSKTGAFSFEIKFPKDVKNLGFYYINFEYRGNSFSHQLKCEEFKNPPFLVDVEVLNESTIYLDEEIKVKLSAKYLDYTPVKMAKLEWKFRKGERSINPKKGYSFGKNDRRFGMGKHFFGGKRRWRRNYNRGPWTKIEAMTDENGECKRVLTLKDIDGDEIKENCVNVEIEGTVQDIDKSTISGGSSILLYPSEYYVGLKLKKYSYNIGQFLRVSFVVVDKDGILHKDIEVVLEIFDQNNDEKPFYKKVFLSQLKPVEFIDLEKKNLKQFEKGGSFKVVCRVKDKKGKSHMCSSTFNYNKRKETGVDKIELEEVSLIANKDTYVIGDTAKILVESPFDPKSFCSGVLFLCAETLNYAKTFTMSKEDNNSLVVDIPLKDDNLFPNVKLFCTLFGQKKSKKLEKILTSYGRGELPLTISIESKNIKISVKTLQKKYMPGEECEIHIKVNEKELQNAEITLIVVDKTVLSLTQYDLTSPLNNFYQKHNPTASFKNVRNAIFMKIVDAKKMNEIKEDCNEKKNKKIPKVSKGFFKCFGKKCSKKGGKPGKISRIQKKIEKDENQPVVAFRKNFKALAYFNPVIIPDEKMEAKVKFKLPELLTSFSIWALVANDKRFGIGKSEVMTELDFTAEGRFPQFLNFGDKIDLQIMLSNKTNEDKKAIVFVYFDEKIEFQKQIKKKEFEINVPKKGKTRLLIPIVSKGLGNSKINCIAKVKDSKLKDAFEDYIEIIRPQTLESFCQYGELSKDDDKCKTVIKIPINEVFSDVGGVSLNFSSTALSHLTDCFLYLYGYKFNCCEQISSKVFGICSVGYILEQFNVPNFPTKEKLFNVLKTALGKYKSAQRSDGGFGFWSNSGFSWPYVSLYVIQAMILIKESNRIDVDISMLNKAKNYCLAVKNKGDSYFEIDHYKWYSRCNRYSIRSFALYVLVNFFNIKMINDSELKSIVESAVKLFNDSEKESEDHFKMNLEGYGWVLYCIGTCSKEKLNHPIAKKIFEKLNNHVNETAQTANFITNYSRKDSYTMLSSSRRTDGILLEVLCHLKPKKFMNLIPKIVKGLLASKKKGKSWNNTQENKYILLALKKYFQVFEKDVPNFTVNYNLIKSKQTGSAKFKGRETKTETFVVPISKIKEKDECEISKKGKGRLYYRLGIEYSPKNLQLESKDRGFKVKQEYIGIKEDTIKKDKNGVYTFKNGELLRVRVYFESETRRYHVALVCNIPSGCEILNPNLKTTGVIPKDERSYNNDYSHFYSEHRNYRKDRFEAFTSSLHAGKYYTTFVIRANNSGVFVVPPVYLEEMYSPEVFGRGNTLSVMVK